MEDDRARHRAFVIAVHEVRGLLLLRSTKKKKGVHFQLPGGRVDRSEVDRLGLEGAQVVAAARELYEETGIDVRHCSQDRLRRLQFDEDTLASLGPRAFFLMGLTDADAVSADASGIGSTEDSRQHDDFCLRLSSEHDGFRFERDFAQAADAVLLHSGGKCSLAVRAAAPLLVSMYRGGETTGSAGVASNTQP